MSAETIAVLIPELILVLAATFIYVAGAFLPNKNFWAGLGVLAVVAAAVALTGQYERLFWTEGAKEPALTANIGGPLAVDLLGQYVRLLALVVGAVFVLVSARPQNEELVPEVIGTILMATAGLMLVGGSRDLVMLFLGLELISIPTYILLFLGRKDGSSSESAAKYFFLSILSSGITLYGFSYLYGVGGSTRLDEIQAALTKLLTTPETTAPLFAQLALVLVTAGLGFKIAAVPFHFYAPDVYQGTTHANAGLLAVLPKIAGIAALIRIITVALPGTEETAIRLLLILSMVTMTLGNVTALWQDDVRRMMAYSSIAHAGYMLVGLAVAAVVSGAARSNDAALIASLSGIDGIGATLFYTTAYSLASAGLFACFAYFGGPNRSLDKLDDLAGVGRASPFVALAAAVFLFSLTGIPPMPGFFGKLELFYGAIQVGLSESKLAPWFIALAVVGMLNAATSAAYYLRLIGTMYFRTPEGAEAKPAGLGPWAAVVVCTAASVLMMLAPGSFTTASNGAAKSARAVQAAPAPTVAAK